jgi:phytoene desaturase
MSEKSAIIIGAGVAGLATGVYAQMSGYRTRIFEQHSIPGGVCTAWKRYGRCGWIHPIASDSYTIDGCIHFLMGCHPDRGFYQRYREVGALEGNRLIHADDYLRFFDESTERSLQITRDLDQLTQDLRTLAPADGDFIKGFTAGIRAMQGFDLDVIQARSLMRPFPAPKHLWSARHLIGHFARYRIPLETLGKRVHDPFVGWAMSNLFVPEAPVPFIFAVLAQLTMGELAVVEGGSLNFALAMARRYETLGGEITYRADVEEILVKADPAGRGDRAVGVRLSNGSTHYADTVISAADGYSTVFKLLGGRYASRKIRARYERWPLFAPLLLVSFGVAREFREVPPTSVVLLQHPLNIAGRTEQRLVFRVFNYDPTLAPPGKTVVQAYIQTDYDWWEALQKDRACYQEEKARVAADVLDRLEHHLPGISAGVEVTDVATPHTFHRYTRNYRGAFEGWLVTPETIRVTLEHTLPGLRDFYMIGQWTEPGGGIPVVIDAARRFVQMLCRRTENRARRGLS